MFTGFQRTFHLLIITSSDYNIQCLSVSIHYLLLQLVIQIRTEWLPLIRAVVLPIKLRSLPSPNVFEKMASTVRIELTHGLLESLSPNPWNIGGYEIFDGQDLNASLFQIMLGVILLTTAPYSAVKNGSLCRCCPGYSWMKAKWLSWLSNRPLKWCWW